MKGRRSNVAVVMDELNGLTDSIDMKRSLTSPSGPGSSTENFEERMKLGLETLRRGETILRSRDTTLYEQDLVDFWVEHYDEDRSRRNLWNRNLLSDWVKGQDPFIDNLRPPTPDPPEEYAEDEKLEKGWYANYRRGYEFTLEQANKKLKKRLTVMPMVEGVAALTTKKIIAVVDKVKPGLDRTDYKNLPEYYHEVENVEPGSMYVLRVDVADNYPPPITNKEMFDDSSEEEYADEDEDAAADEELDRMMAEGQAADVAPTPPPLRSRITNAMDPRTVLALYNNRADGFYVSIYILRQLIRPSTEETVQSLRLRALEWIKDANVPEKRRLFYNPGNPFLHFLQAKVPRTMGPQFSQYVFGMPRAAIQMQTGLDLNRPFTNWHLGIKHVISKYCESQEKASAWPTMYDVEALAWALDIEIHLYFNSNEYDTASGMYIQDWNSTDENFIRIGPTKAQIPYKLLWSADHQMRFRPLILDIQFSQAQQIRDDLRLDPRDDRQVVLMPSPTDYYRNDYWGGGYDL